MSNQNEPAFPLPAQYGPNDVLEAHASFGLTKLEYFAGSAMQGLIQSGHEDYQFNIPVVVRDSVLYAKALIAALDKEQP